VKLVHLVGFIIKKFVTMHGHNVKFLQFSFAKSKCCSFALNKQNMPQINTLFKHQSQDILEPLKTHAA